LESVCLPPATSFAGAWSESAVHEKHPVTKPLSDALITKLTRSNRLDADDIEAIRRLPMRVNELGPKQKIVADGTRPAECCLLGEGFAVRSKMTPSGERQILSLHIPGEIPDLQSLHLHVMDHDLVTLTSCTLGFISHDNIRQLSRKQPNLADAFWRETLIDAAIFREWLVNLGRRPALPRLAHLLVELYRRLEAIGRASGGEFELPVTQEQLAECLGLSAVHLNRVLQGLRRKGVQKANRQSHQLIVLGFLEQLSGFDPTYLHLDPNV
jgi:CRP-like cAMP-binding protein